MFLYQEDNRYFAQVSDGLQEPTRLELESPGPGNHQLRHSKCAAMVLNDAIADHFRDLTGRRPKSHPDAWIQLHLQDDKATVSVDTSGRPLHKRGYRRRSVAAPLMETLAAAMLAVSGRHGERPPAVFSSGVVWAACKLCAVPTG